MTNVELTEQEWSHFFDIQDIVKGEVQLKIEPDEEERQDMARRLNVKAVNGVAADLTLTQAKGGNIVHVKGQFEANVTQTCVVTAEDMEVTLSEPVEGWYADKDRTVSFAAAKREREAATSRGEIEMVDEAEDPEAVVDGAIDLGELVTQHLSLALPPYPRKEGVNYEHGDENVEIDEKSPLRRNPFEALKDWKENR